MNSLTIDIFDTVVSFLDNARDILHFSYTCKNHFNFFKKSNDKVVKLMLITKQCLLNKTLLTIKDVITLLCFKDVLLFKYYYNYLDDHNSKELLKQLLQNKIQIPYEKLKWNIKFCINNQKDDIVFCINNHKFIFESFYDILCTFTFENSIYFTEAILNSNLNSNLASATELLNLIIIDLLIENFYKDKVESFYQVARRYSKIIEKFSYFITNEEPTTNIKRFVINSIVLLGI